MQVAVEQLLRERMNKRTLAAILGFKQAQCDQHLPDQLASRLRHVILQECNAYLDFVLDILASVDDETVVLNEVWLDRLGEMYDRIVRPTFEEDNQDEVVTVGVNGSG